MSMQQQPKTAADYLAQAEQVGDILTVKNANADLAGAAWWASIATANALIAIALQLGVPNGAPHQPPRGAAAGAPESPAQAQAGA